MESRGNTHADVLEMWAHVGSGLQRGIDCVKARSLDGVSKSAGGPVGRVVVCNYLAFPLTFRLSLSLNCVQRVEKRGAASSRSTG